MRTALAIVQSFCRLSNVPVPTALYGATDPSVLQLTEALYSALADLRQAACFEVQKQKYSFSTEASRAQYPLPANFYKPIPQTHYNQSTDLQLIHASDSDMAYMLYGNGGDESEYSFRIFGPDVARTTLGQMELHPTPSSIVTLSFEYINANLVLPATWTAADSDLYETIGADTYVVPFDYDLVLLGLSAKFRNPTGGDWQSAEAEFQRKISAASARLTGPVRGSFAGKKRFSRYETQYKGWTLT